MTGLQITAILYSIKQIKEMLLVIDYQVSIDKESGKFIVKGPFDVNSMPVEIPEDNPNREQFIDLFLHKADIEQGIDFLRSISIDKDNTINEGLFIAGLNNCMKCFKYSNARSKLDKKIVFSDNEQMMEQFVEFEKMRDKHFDHDESGMLQATAFLVVCSNGERIFGGPPSVVWNRAMLDYYVAGQGLQEVMQFTWRFVCKEIDDIGNLIETTYKDFSRESLIRLQAPQIKLASSNLERK